MSEPRLYDFDLHLRLAEAGWAGAYWHLPDGQRLCQQLTFIFNRPFDVAADAVAAVASGQPEADFEWFDEPSHMRFRLVRPLQRPHLVDLRCWESPNPRDARDIDLDVDAPTWEALVPTDLLVVVFHAELTKIQTLLKLPQYAKNRTALTCHTAIATLAKYAAAIMKQQAKGNPP